MKSHRTTYLLLAVTAVVWGIVAWKLFSSTAPPPAPSRPTATTVKQAVPDTLRLDYPDPFLKGKAAAVRTTAVTRLAPASKPARRTKIQVVHLGTVAAGSRRYYLLTVNGQPYEAERGGMAGEFRIEGVDTDSVYLTKDGVTYGVKLCE